MNKIYYIIKSLIFTILLVFITLLIILNTNGYKNDNLIENKNFTYIPFCIIYLILLLGFIVYEQIKKINFKKIIIDIILFIIFIFVFLFEVKIQDLNLAYSAKIFMSLLAILYFIYTFESLIITFNFIFPNFLKEN